MFKIIRSLRNRKNVRTFESGKYMHGRLAATRSRRLMEILFAAAEAEGKNVYELDLLFFKTDDGRLYVNPSPEVEEKYMSGPIQDISCDEEFLTVIAQHGEKSFETQFVLA